MDTEQKRVIDALHAAMALEDDGKQCYIDGAQRASNEVGRKLLASLAAEEAGHRRHLEEIYESIRAKKGWPKLRLEPETGERLRDLLVTTCERAGVNVGGGDGDFEAIQAAIEKEKQSYDFYTRHSRQATYPAEREFYREVASEEREHELVLLDYYEYLKDPAGFFTKLERHSLDGG